MKIKDYENGMKMLDDLLQCEKNTEIEGEALLLKARFMEKLNKPTEAAINYEQASKYGSAKVATKALYKLAKFRIRQQDYYEALFTFKRIPSKSLTKKMQVYKCITDGVNT